MTLPKNIPPSSVASAVNAEPVHALDSQQGPHDPLAPTTPLAFVWADLHKPTLRNGSQSNPRLRARSQFD